MAQAVDWHGANKTLGPPKGMDETQVSSLRIFNNGVSSVSCWELSNEELEEVTRTKRVFLSVFFGQTQPPVFIGSESEVRRMNADYGVWPASARVG